MTEDEKMLSRECGDNMENMRAKHLPRGRGRNEMGGINKNRPDSFPPSLKPKPTLTIYTERTDLAYEV